MGRFSTDPPEPEHTEQEWLAHLAEECRCCECCQAVPCPGLKQGGFCDEWACTCRDYEDGDRDYE